MAENPTSVDGLSAQQAAFSAGRAMLAAFASVGVRSFDVTQTNIEGEKTGLQPNRPIDELSRAIGKNLAAAIGD